ncbi:MAG TPA: SpoIIE family protein phosphatase [Actinomycetota bacterium]|nr:SpoIIE family protein phosphatase [Actinomycetota bacterium]
MTNDLSAGVEPGGRERDGEIEATLDALRKDAEIAHVLLGFASALAEVRTVDATIELTMQLVPKVMGCDRCFIAALNRADGRLYVMNKGGFTDEEARAFESLLHPSGSLPLLRRAIHDQAPLIVEDANNDHRITREEAELRNLGALMRIPLIREGEVYGALALEYRKPRVFDSKEASLARGIGHQLAVALANARQYNLLASLSRFGPRIATRFRLREVSEEVASGAADLLGGDAARLYLIDQARRSLFPAAGSGEAPAGRFDRIDLAQNPWAELLAGRTAMISKEGDPAAVIAAPVMGTASLLGAVLVFFDRNVAMGEVETEALKVLASLSALALQNAQRFERQRRVARSLQQGLLSTETPALIGSQVAAVYEPASSESDVGGDFYDVFEVRKGVYGLVVGDVAGKGAEAAALTAQAKYMLRAFASRNRSPASVLFHLNNALSASLDVDRFATLVYVVYDTDRQRCVMSSAGHPAALLFRADDGSVEALELSGMVLGAFANQQFEQTEIDLRPGDVLLAHTDGLTEARSDTGEMFERERVERLLADLAPRTEPAELARAIYGEAKAFGRVTDDTVVFTLACPRT